MDLQQQKELIILYKQYQNTDRNIIKANLKQQLDKANYDLSYLTEATGLSRNTVLQLRRLGNNYRPDFITAVVLCDLLRIPITEIMQGVGVDIDARPKKTKWTSKIKKQFIEDCEKLTPSEVCEKYNIAPRTMVEYERLFRNEIQELQK